MVVTPDGPSRLVVAGIDKGHAFDRGTVTKTYKNVKDSDLATQIAQRYGLSADTDDSKVVHDYVIQNNLSDYDFLMERAAIAGFRVYVDDKKLLFKKPKLGDPPAAKLEWREIIGRLVQEVNTFDQVSKITTSGWDPKQAKEMTDAGKGGDEYGKQGGTMTGAQLVKQMYGDIEEVLTVATGEKSLLEAVAKAEYNRRAGSFVHAEARVTGDPAIRAGSVVEVEKAGKRVDGQYYVVSTDHLFFVDTGYATEFRGKRYTIKSVESRLAGLKDYVAQAAAKVEEAAQEAANASQQVAREALTRAHQAASQVTDIASQAIQHAKDAYDAVKAAVLDAVHTTGDQL